MRRIPAAQMGPIRITDFSSSTRWTLLSLHKLGASEDLRSSSSVTIAALSRNLHNRWVGYYLLTSNQIKGKNWWCSYVMDCLGRKQKEKQMHQKEKHIMFLIIVIREMVNSTIILLTFTFNIKLISKNTKMETAKTQETRISN